MATLQTSKVAASYQARAGIDLTAVTASYSLSAALALNDVIQMVKIPKDATVLEVILACDDLDTGGSPAIVLDVGDGGDTDRFIDGATIGQTGGYVRLGQGITTAGDAGAAYKYTEEDTIDVLVQAGPQTGATSGTLTLTVFYTMQTV